ncbi:hypothetical protein F5Y04DRAFT_165379 [Hypomontagnella monticulosa]|nr:hypothetical protein F5Y04DRAFT_165379 [Hypomontagnella monticulosa]
MAAPAIDVSNYPPLDRPNSRFHKRPKNARPAPPTSGNHEKDVNVLLYVNNGPRKNVDESGRDYARRFITGPPADQIKPNSIGVDYNDGRAIFGTKAGQDLLDELDSAIDLIRVQGSGNQDIDRMIRNMFGHSAMYGSNTTSRAESIIFLASLYCAIRFRFLSNGLYGEPNARFAHHALADIDRKRWAGNTLAHTASLETDLLWARYQHISHQNIGPFRNTEATSHTFFEYMYRMTINEAASLVRLATETDAQGNRAPNAPRFGIIVNLINKFVSWRGKHTEMWSQSMKQMRIEPRQRINHWAEWGGVEVDRAYENFISSVLSAVSAVQRGQRVMPAHIESIRRASYHLTQTARELENSFWQHQDHQGAYDRNRSRGGVNPLFPRELEFTYEDSLPRVNFRWIPEVTAVPENRPPIRSDPDFVQEDRQRLPGPRYTGQMTAPYYDVWPDVIPQDIPNMANLNIAHLAQSVAGDDSPYFDYSDEEYDMGWEEEDSPPSSPTFPSEIPRPPVKYEAPSAFITGGILPKRSLDGDLPMAKRVKVSAY